MSNNDKQVQEALQAIRKLVEASEDNLAASDDVVTLDNVVWRNPVKDESEAVEASAEGVSERKTPDVSQNAGPVELKWAEDEGATSGKAPQASASISARDLDEIAKARDSQRTFLKTPVTSPLDLQTPAIQQSDIALSHQPTPPVNGPDEQIKPNTAELTADFKTDLKPPVRDEDDAITELTSPLGRKGGGFYDEVPAPLSALQRPLLPTFASQNEAASLASAPQIEEASSSSSPSSSPSPNNEASPVPLAEPAITDFHGLDFNFSAAEGLMSAASFEELNKGPITPEVAIPTAEPAVADPVLAVQAMYPAAQDEASEARDDETFEATGHPNLHIVSDKSAIDDDEEEGFSGAVRLALRSIIKEQVSSWLQGNMTGLIEEALTTPQKRPSGSSKPTSKKR